jgi:hypothetical protein
MPYSGQNRVLEQGCRVVSVEKSTALSAYRLLDGLIPPGGTV